MHKKNFIVSSFYKFVHLSDVDEKIIFLKRKLNKFNIKGTFILGVEGVNGSFSVKSNEFKNICELLDKTISTNVKYKTQNTDHHSFLRLKFKLKKEIVTMGEENIDPKKKSGKYLNPDSWDNLINMKDSLIIDTRNSYESEVGTFKNSLKTRTKNFRDFPNWIKKNKRMLRNKKIGVFCTGGVRCEKASSYMINLGLTDVYQLHGGIIEYLNKTKNKNKLWKGECFVFDERVTLNENLEKGSYSQCFACRSAITKEEMKSSFYESGVSCPKCFKVKSEVQRNRYKERQRQMKIAKKKKIKHLGT